MDEECGSFGGKETFMQDTERRAAWLYIDYQLDAMIIIFS